MARKKQNGPDPIVEAIRELGRNLGGRIDQTNERLETGFTRVEDAIEQLKQTDERLGERIDRTNERLERTNERLERTNERIDVLAQATSQGFARVETRLDEIIRNTGSHYRELGERVGALEAWRRTQTSEPNP